MSLNASSALSQVKGVGEKFAAEFQRAGLDTVQDLLLHFPSRYIDLTHRPTRLQEGREGTYRIHIRTIQLSRNFKKRMSVLRLGTDLKGIPLTVVYFNQPYLRDFFKRHRDVWVYGLAVRREEGLQMVNPLYFTSETLRDVIPVYRPLGRIKSARLRRVIANALFEFSDPGDALPGPLVEAYDFPGFLEAMRLIHLPDSLAVDAMDRARKRFIYTEFLFYHIELLFVRSHFRTVHRIHSYRVGHHLREIVAHRLSFDLTGDQWRALEDIVNDLKSPVAMHRLIQGDVGTGKTVLAFLALYLAVESGHQGAFLAPTEILAQQHFLAAASFFSDLSIELLTGSTPAKDRDRLFRSLEQGRTQIVFGTHALLSQHLKFRDLSLVVIDEQHRFGVSQRAALYYKGEAVDLLVTTATPIPRTMLLTVFNDIRVSKMSERPAGRPPVETRIVSRRRRDRFYSWLSERVKRGEKAYIVLPLIEPSDSFPQLTSIQEALPFYRAVFSPLAIGVVSGRSSAHEKERTLRRFSNGDLSILVATTVIEVGVDVPDATVIVIENADRYGLAQLHQLRGRVGRGEHKSVCYLMPSEHLTDGGKQRLKCIESTEDGFRIAEMDLQMRGGGLISGWEQTGYFDFRVGDLKSDYPLFLQARGDAQAVLQGEIAASDAVKDFIERLKVKVGKISFS